MSEPSPYKVLFITGTGRSGTTILDVTLGQIDSFFSTGELFNIFDRKLRCGCGQNVHSTCKVWPKILQEAYGNQAQIDEALQILYRGKVRYHLWEFLRQLPYQDRERLYTTFKEYIETLHCLYDAIHRVTGAEIIVDSSKLPLQALLLASAPGIDLYILHLVRDVRAVLYSWLQRKKYYPRSFANSLWLWVRSNVSAELFLRSEPHYMRLRYEDFAANPRESVEQILAFAEHPTEHSPFISDHELTYRTTHTVAGNPERIIKGSTLTIHLDAEWRSSKPALSQRLGTLLTMPLLLHYGYLPQRQNHHSYQKAKD